MANDWNFIKNILAIEDQKSGKITRDQMLEQIAEPASNPNGSAAQRKPGTRYGMLYSKKGIKQYGEYSHTAHFVDVWNTDGSVTLCGIPSNDLKTKIAGCRGATNCPTCYAKMIELGQR